jgi:hypothetical protein
MTIWNVVLGLIVMVWAFGFGQVDAPWTPKPRQLAAPTARSG